ncbi:MAG: ribosome silencing factor [Rhodospirillales bacterium]|nr:ribosome silencing factor [Rhodospirillales bacterium]
MTVPDRPVRSTRRESVKADAEALHRAVAGALADAKAEDIVTIDLDGKTTIADLMVIASGRSKRHVNAVAERLLKQLKDDGTPALAAEGRENSDWVLIDAGDIIVHVFRPEIRALYNLEKMWSVEAIGAAEEQALAGED